MVGQGFEILYLDASPPEAADAPLKRLDSAASGPDSIEATVIQRSSSVMGGDSTLTVDISCSSS